MTCTKCGKSPKWWQSVYTRVCDCNPGWAVSELNEMFYPSDEDMIMISDMSEKKSMKISLGTLKKYLLKP